MSFLMAGYDSLLERLWNSSAERPNRDGSKVSSIFAQTIRFWCGYNKLVPVVTRKRLAWKQVMAELTWMLNGDTNTAYLHQHNCHIWDEWADANGDLGPIYGAQWRGGQGRPDQLGQVLAALRDPEQRYSRRLIVESWQASDIDKMALPPCHKSMQFYVDCDAQGALHLLVNQRSADVFLGLPFNIASYATLLHLVAVSTGLMPGQLTFSLGDAHLYENHRDAAKEYLSRDIPLPPPTLDISTSGVGFGHDLRNIDPNTLRLVGYTPLPAIKAPITV